MSDRVMNPGIVVGIDGSPQSNAAVRWAVREATMRNAALTLVHAAAPGTVGAPRQVLADAVEMVENLTDEPSRPPISTELAHKPPVPTLVDASATADLVVVGCRAQGTVKRLLPGSVSAGLVHHTHCPVAIIHDAATAAAQGPVLVGICGSPTSEPATAIAFDEAARRGAELVALYAWTDAEIPDLPPREWTGLTRISWPALHSAAEKTLAERLARWQDRYPGVPVRQMVVVNRPAEHLLECAQSAQLVVVGSNRRGGLAGMLLGSVCNAVVRAVRTPVIIAAAL
ncbi:universal stress protein [Mycobacterium sp.]|uniref:universal stress protein n=1 Tax=Mycobacterium sp. TaxID=1785 RepID=UPI00127844A3|nr:universal stress protein [Mycobacterium sp.]KAA8961646.1 MAG: universal stress protein [Mycobacterium sp.]